MCKRILCLAGCAALSFLATAIGSCRDGTIKDPIVCVPDCGVRVCGPVPNDCGESCGTCADPKSCDISSGQCEECRPNCTGRECGPDPQNCGTSCGTCKPPDQHCNPTTGGCEGCSPDCGARVCGPVPNGCGASCGSCKDSESCDVLDGQCDELPINAFYVATNGDDSNPGTLSSPWRTVQHAADTVSAGDTVYVRAGTYKEKIFIRSSGSYGNVITYSAYPDETVTIDANDAPAVGSWDALVTITGSYLVFQDFNVINSNWAGIYVRSAGTVTIQGNYVAETKSSGILVGGAGAGVSESSNVKVLNNELYHTAGKATPEFESQESVSVQYGVDGFEVAHNLIHDVGNGTSNGREGIVVKNGSKNGTIHHNHLYSIPSVAIYVDSWSEYLQNVDIYDNLVEGGSGGIAVSSESGGTTDGVRIFNNIITNTTITGLLFPAYDDGSGGTIKNIEVINNTIYGNHNSDGGIWIGAWASTYVQNLTIRNNILSENTPTNIKQTNAERHSNIVIDHNLFFGSGGTFGDDIIIGDPLFVNPAGGDYHIRNGSPAIDSGISALAPSVDFDGNPRPYGAGYDLGAFEYR